MFRLDHFVGYIGATLVILLSFNGVIADKNPPPHSSTVVRADATQPAGLPILLTVTVTNNGKEAIVYWTDFGHYPPGFWFEARFTDARGKVHEARLSNDQGHPGSGGGRQIQPGDSVTAPAMMVPLPVGSYTIQVWNGKSAVVTVKDDPQLARKWDQDILAKIRKGDPFGRYVACTYLAGKNPGKSLIHDLLQDLLSADEVIADRAADPLLRVRELPPNSEPIITKALRKHIGLVKERGSAKTSILTSLAALAAHIGTDNALESVLTLARNEEERGAAIAALGSFKQEKAIQELRLFLTDKNETLQFRAAQRLAERKDPAALDVLLAVAIDPKSRWRAYSFESLLKYSDDPRVEPAIKSGLNDPDSFVRGQAEFALRNLRPAKKP